MLSDEWKLLALRMRDILNNDHSYKESLIVVPSLFQQFPSLREKSRRLYVIFLLFHREIAQSFKFEAFCKLFL